MTRADPSKRAVVTVGVNPQRNFGPYLARFDRTIRRSGLACADNVWIWGSDWPPGSPPHVQCHYAFKVYAVKEAVRRGATSVLWLDSSAYAIRPLEPMWQEIEREGHYLCGEWAQDREKLGQWASDHCLEHFGISRDEAMNLPLFSGTCFGLDFTNPRSRTWFDRLVSYAVPEHFNGTHKSRLRVPGAQIPGEEGKRMSDDPRCQGHRSDEPYMGLLARELGMKSHGIGLFAGGLGVYPETVLCSGYNLPPEGDIEPSLEVVGEHTIDTTLVSGGGYVLDAGCRDFAFARTLANRGCKVIALDADPTVTDPGIENVAFMNLALADKAGEMAFVMSPDPQARHLAPGHGEIGGPPRVKVNVTTLDALMEGLGMDVSRVGTWDCVKLDIEGAEMGILRAWPGPVAKQISIEFHEHVWPQTQAAYDSIFKYLGAWYRVVQHRKEARYCCSENWWDSLLVLKEPYLGQVR